MFPTPSEQISLDKSLQCDLLCFQLEFLAVPWFNDSVVGRRVWLPFPKFVLFACALLLLRLYANRAKVKMENFNDDERWKNKKAVLE